MCGICGIVGIRAEDTLKAMAQAIFHRGPDENGFFFHDNISLGNTRLSIIDLSTGTQPIYNEDKTLVIVFNGEIYNFQALREELVSKGHKFYTRSDTEVIIHAYEEYGVNCLQRFNGDFAFAIYDIINDQTFIARDRLGIRPLYYNVQGDKIIFASELKSVLASGLVKRELNYKALDKYLTLRYCWGNESFIQNVYKLPPAHYMLIKNGRMDIKKYWDIDYTPNNLKNVEEYAAQFEEIFTNSVKLRMISDVPFGAFLSGGLDSSLIVAMMAKYSNLPVETYSLGFNLDIDETSDSAMLAKELGCNHHEIMIDTKSYNLLPEIVKCFDEPLGDAIIIPTFVLAKEAAKSLKVVLTGEGADEIFGAYVHQLAMSHGSFLNKLIPSPFRSGALIPLIKSLPLNMLDKIFPYPSSMGEKGREKLVQYLTFLGDNLNSYFSIASIFNAEDKSRFYTTNLKQKLGNFEVRDDFSKILKENENLPVLNQLIDLDTNYWLADYTLYKQDRITMGNSIEGRIPYLDHNLVEFTAKIPVHYKFTGLSTKYLLRKVAKSYLPRSIASRSKKAFYFPYQKCFGEDFNFYLKELLNKNSFIIKLDLINQTEIDNLRDRALNAEILPSKQLMSIIILENWLREYLRV